MPSPSYSGSPARRVSSLRYRRGSLRGALLLTGTLGYFLYVYASMALGTVVYNELFLAYVVLFSASLFAFVLALTGIDHGDGRTVLGRTTRGADPPYSCLAAPW